MYKKQIELNDRFEFFIKNIKRAYTGDNEVEDQLPKHARASGTGGHEYSEKEGSDEVSLVSVFIYLFLPQINGF